LFLDESSNLRAGSLIIAIVKNRREASISCSHRRLGCKLKDVEDMAFKHLKVNMKPYSVDLYTDSHTIIQERYGDSTVSPSEVFSRKFMLPINPFWN
jgi:hypothetical protein